MSLRDSIHQLIRPHMTKRPDGKIVTRPALLDQLADAVKPSGRSRSGSSGTRLPINTDAIELWKRLDTQARQEELERNGRSAGHLGANIAAWETEPRAEWVQHLEHVALDIIDQINNLLDPPIPRRALQQPCPACAMTWVLNEQGDRTSALTARDRDPETGGVLKEDEMDITCAYCGAEWRNSEDDHRLTWILQVLANQRVADMEKAG